MAPMGVRQAVAERLRSGCGPVTTDGRRKCCGGLQGAGKERLDIGYNICLNGALEVLGGVLRRGGGLQRRHCLLVTCWIGAGDVTAYLVGNRGRLTEDSGRRCRGGSIAFADRKNGNGFKMCACAG